METTQTQVRRCTVYRGRGRADELEMEPTPPYHLSRPDCVPIRTIMSRDLVCAGPDLDISAVIGLMIDKHIGCLPVVDERRHPIGVITKFDLVEQLNAAMRLLGGGCPLPSDLAAKTADDVMMPIALTLDEHATISHAAAMMVSEDTHHVLLVSRDGALVGVVSAKDVVRWVAEPDAPRREASRGRPPAWHPLES